MKFNPHGKTGGMSSYPQFEVRLLTSSPTTTRSESRDLVSYNK
jgi:hypothetical protein